MRLVFLTHRLPYAPNRGDRVRAFHELRALAARYEVHVASLVHDNEEARHAGDLARQVASVSVIPVPRVRNYLRGAAKLATERPLTHLLLDGPSVHSVLRGILDRHHPVLTFAFCSGMARFAMQPPLDSLPFVLDMVDVDSAKWGALAEGASQPRKWVFRREQRLLGAFEVSAARAAQATWVVNEREAAILRQLAGPSVAVTPVQNGVDLPALSPPDPPPESEDVVFCGVMNYEPNEQGAVWLATHVWPTVKAARPTARLVLVGSDPTARVRSLACDPSVVVTGSVPDVRPFLWRAAASAAPLHVARGVQNKVLEAVAAGLPAVVTPAVADGLPGPLLPACIVAGDPSSFARGLLDLLALAPGPRRARAQSADFSLLGWESRLAPMLATIESLLQARSAAS